MSRVAAFVIMLFGALGIVRCGPAPNNKQAPMATESELHRALSAGVPADVQALLDQGADPNVPGHCGRTPLMTAIEARSLEKLRILLSHGADPEKTDDFNNTAIATAVQHDFLEAVAVLLDLGVDLGHAPKYPLKPVDYSFDLPDALMPPELQGVMDETEWQRLAAEGLEELQKQGQAPKAEPVIESVTSVAMLKLLVAAGEDLNLAPEEVKRELVGLNDEGGSRATADDYQQYRSPRFGTSNPEPMTNPFWSDMIRLGVNAYEARERFGDKDAFDGQGPVWCFDRFGDTITPLPDGRFLQVAGEHEDYYDPDFCIYNDVVVHDGRGGFEVYGYPRDVFPPTDFHTATLVEEWVYLIGNLGYPEERQEGETQVLRIDISTLRIEHVGTAGESPGWISRHHAEYDPEAHAITVSRGEVFSALADDGGLHPNVDRYAIDLERRTWSVSRR